MILQFVALLFAAVAVQVAIIFKVADLVSAKLQPSEMEEIALAPAWPVL